MLALRQLPRAPAYRPKILLIKQNYSAGDPHMYDFLPTTTETRPGLEHVCIGTFVIPDALCLVPGAWRLVVGVRCLVHNVGAWYSVPGALRLVLLVCRLNYAHTH